VPDREEQRHRCPVALIVSTWVWGDKYPGHYLHRLEAAVRRNLSGEFRFQTFRPGLCDEHLTRIPGCFARLRAFDPEWQSSNGIEPGDRIVTLDLDLIVTGSLDGLFDREEPFTILQGVNASNPCPYNGSVWMLRAGYRPDIWSEFTLERAAKVPHDAFPDDQAWFAHHMPGAGAFGPKDGVYAFQKPGWPKGAGLPAGARIVAFPGHRDPSQFTGLDWVREHWR